MKISQVKTQNRGLAPIFKNYYNRATQIQQKQQNINQLHIPWASKSPDHNVIVHLWDELNWCVRRHPATGV